MSDDAAQVTVRIDGCQHRAQWARDEVLLDALIRQEIDVPYSCQEGHCGACVCRVVDGNVSMVNGTALQSVDIEDGYILACQAVRVTDSITISYDD